MTTGRLVLKGLAVLTFVVGAAFVLFSDLSVIDGLAFALVGLALDSAGDLVR